MNKKKTRLQNVTTLNSRNNFVMNDVTQRHLTLKRGLITFFITIVYIALSTIPLPYLHQDMLYNLMQHQHLQALELINLFDGSNLQQGSLMMIGFMPFITIQLIMQVLQTGLSKHVKLLSETATGQEKIGRITKALTAPLTFAQALITLITLEHATDNQIISSAYPLPVLLIYLSLIATAGTMIIIWLSDLNTLYGLGNGMNYLISCSIIVSLVQNTNFSWNVLQTWYNAVGNKLIWLGLGLLVIFWLYNAVYIWFQSSYLSLPLQFSQLNSSAIKSGSLPFSLNVSNVMPICFASILMNFLYIISLWFKDDKAFRDLVNFKSWWSIAIYTILLIIFTFIFVLITYYPQNLAENLDRQNIYIKGVPPTIETISFLRNILMKLSLGNIAFLMLVVVIPMIIFKCVGLSASLILSSSTIFIVITTEIDIRMQIGGLKAKSHVPTLY